MGYAIGVIDGNDDAFRYRVFGEKSNSGLDFLARQQDRIERFTPLLNNGMESFFQKTREVYDRFNSSDALRRMRAAVSQLTHCMQPDTIRALTNLDDIQQAPPVMQRWLMANITIRERYHAQLCDGYSETFVDHYFDQRGEDHYDYRRVMQGIAVDQPDGTWQSSQWDDELYADDRELDIAEQADILNTWENAEMFLKREETDPTSIWNSSL
jgi:hypothetical protein